MTPNADRIDPRAAVVVQANSVRSTLTHQNSAVRDEQIEAFIEPEQTGQVGRYPIYRGQWVVMTFERRSRPVRRQRATPGLRGDDAASRRDAGLGCDRSPVAVSADRISVPGQRPAIQIDDGTGGVLTGRKAERLQRGRSLRFDGSEGVLPARTTPTRLDLATVDSSALKIEVLAWCVREFLQLLVARDKVPRCRCHGAG